MHKQTGPLASASSAELRAIPPDYIDAVWPEVEHWIDEAAFYSPYRTTQDVLAAIKDNRAHLWVISIGPELVAAFVTQLNKDKQGKVCTIWACGGRKGTLLRWIHFILDVEAWAKHEGCYAMRHSLRPEWVPLLSKRYGYTQTHATVQKAI